MKKVFLLLLFCQVVSPVTHSLKTFFTGSTGVPNLPEFVGVVMVDEIEVVYCDSNKMRAEPKQDWMEKVIEDDPTHIDRHTKECQEDQSFFSSFIKILMQSFDQTGGEFIFHSVQLQLVYLT
ncbi:hypothetical protein L3Q82_015260 [Scortum barcoo]|uniref:Uncharacterized protein n=1 Tax=Scortum barcoo TaxID=214431 RepID=A0ACB8VTR5_9TELE|nr:hypothetical protein L3Q82_015260 [Scortum barcoo]